MINTSTSGQGVLISPSHARESRLSLLHGSAGLRFQWRLIGVASHRLSLYPDRLPVLHRRSELLSRIREFDQWANAWRIALPPVWGHGVSCGTIASGFRSASAHTLILPVAQIGDPISNTSARDSNKRGAVPRAPPFFQCPLGDAQELRYRPLIDLNNVHPIRHVALIWNNHTRAIVL